jgi:hypothetical protein
MSAQISTEPVTMMECPICMDEINPSKNCIITDCNHTFHASCMLKSIVFGNFDCPCCRFELTESPVEDDEDEEEENEEYREAFEDYELYVGFRALFVRAEGNEYDEDDEYEEEEVNIPLNYFVNKLKNLSYTYEDLVKLIADEACNKVEVEERTSNLIEVFQDIVNNYNPGDEVQLEAQAEAQVELKTEVKPPVTVARFRNTIDLCGNN